MDSVHKTALVPTQRARGELTTQTPGQVAHVQALDELADLAAELAHAPSTRRLYAWAWKRFESFCDRRGLASMPADPRTVRAFITAYATGLRADARLDREGSPDKETHAVGAATIRALRCAIAAKHNDAGHVSPTVDPKVKQSMKAAMKICAQRLKRKREGKVKPPSGTSKPKREYRTGKAPALELELLEKIVTAIPADLRGLRDRAILTVLYGAGFRRSEVVALRVDDLQFGDDVILVTIRQSKTDQEGVGRVVPLHAHSDPMTCPIVNLNAWLAASGVTDGLIFRGIHKNQRSLLKTFGGQLVAKALRARMTAAGVLSPEEIRRFAAHSARRGFITEAIRDGATPADVQSYSGHGSVEMVYRYVEEAKRGQADAISRRLQRRKPRNHTDGDHE